MIKLPDQPEHEAGAARSLGERLMELAPGVRPAAQPHHVGMPAHIGRVGLVAVALQQAVVVAEEFFGLVMAPG